MFHTQGAVPLASNAYVVREFEDAVFRELLSSRWVLLLGPRQHGKSTGIVRIKQKLNEAGLIVSNVDLQAMPPCESYLDMLRWFSNEIGKRLSISCPYLPNDGDGNSLLSWLKTIFASVIEPIVIIVDEAASIENSIFRNSFYGQIREISSLRAEDPHELPARLRFVFAGTFRPEALVQEQNSPFNVCETIYTEDLSTEKAKDLVLEIAPDLAEFAERVFAYVGGQPYLIQTIFKKLVDSDVVDFDCKLTEILDELKYDVVSHLDSIFSKIITIPSLVQKISGIVGSNEIPVVPGDSDFAYLQVLGLAKRCNAKLTFRNKFYEEASKNSPQLLPAAASRPVTTVYHLTAADFSFMTNQALAAFALSSYHGAKNCHNSSNYRLALVGFGAAMEAVLIDFLTTLTPAVLQSAITSAGRLTPRPNFSTPYELANDPSTWRLVNLICVARCARIGASAPEPSHALRDWRNLVHPKVAIVSFSDENHLAPESAAAAALLAILTRDLAAAAVHP